MRGAYLLSYWLDYHFRSLHRSDKIYLIPTLKCIPMRENKRKINKMSLPILDDVIEEGSNNPELGELPTALSEMQKKALEQEIEKILEQRFQALFDKTAQKAIKDIKTHLDKVLPKMLEDLPIDWEREL